MAGLNLRLPNDLLKRLEQEAQRSNRPRSQIARRALAEWLKARENERYREAMIRAAEQIYSDPELTGEARQIQEDFDAVDDSLAQIEAQERIAGDSPAKKWWG